MVKRNSSIFPKVKESCIYFLEDVNNNPVYIGRVGPGGFANRMLQHSKMPYFQQVVKINIIICVNETELSILEPYYINKYKPQYNTQFIYGESRITINEDFFTKIFKWERST